MRVDREQALNNKNDNNKRGECTMRKKDDLVKMGLTKNEDDVKIFVENSWKKWYNNYVVFLSFS